MRVDGPGTGDGFELFCNSEAGEWDATDASRAIEEEEAASCETNGIEYTELPVGIDGLTLVVNKDSKIKCVDQASCTRSSGPSPAAAT